MIVYGWRYVYRDFRSETFPDWGSAVRDLVARFPATAPFAEYFLTLEAMEGSAADLHPVRPDEREGGTGSFSVRA